jgi:hypothetical protein
MAKGEGGREEISNGRNYGQKSGMRVSEFIENAGI